MALGFVVMPECAPLRRENQHTCTSHIKGGEAEWLNSPQRRVSHDFYFHPAKFQVLVRNASGEIRQAVREGSLRVGRET